MTYTFKLARRLAVSRAFVLLPVLLGLTACSDSDTTAPQGTPAELPESGIYGWRPRESTPVAVKIIPSSVTIESNQLIQFQASGRNRAGDKVVAPVTWSTTGGTILPDGRFSASVLGTYEVTGTASTYEGETLVETATVSVVRRQARLKDIIITPDSAALLSGASQTFSVVGQLANEDIVPIGVTWVATGGTIDAGGTYLAGDTAGTYRVIATKDAGTIADTASITISRPPEPAPEPAPEPPPAPVLAQVIVKPGSVTLAPGASKQFSFYGVTTTGDSIAVAPSFSASGGTVTSGGLYTAGTTAGTYRVIAAIDGLADTSGVTITSPLGSGTPQGIAYGAFNLLYSTYNPDGTLVPALTMSFDGYKADNIISRIDLARSSKMHLVLAMTGGGHANYMSTINGVYQFDRSKWEARMDTYNTSAIKSAVAAAVSDGTIIGASVMDEPQVSGAGDGNTWGPVGTMTKARVDSLCGYVKQIFPTLPTGVVHRHDVFEPTKSYRVCEFIASQYSSRIGSVTAFRDGGLALAKRDGHAIMFSMNILNGGTQDKDGTWDCTGTGGMGTYSPNCRMTAAQVREFGLVLGPAGCGLLMWRYDDLFVSNSDNRQAFKDVGDNLATLPGKRCIRQ